MHIASRARRRPLAATAVVIAMVAATFITRSQHAGAATAMSEGVLCDTNAQQTFSLTAGDGYVSTPDGNSLYTWSYSNSSRSFQLPGPTL
ncbi:MAG: hypothetical protein QOH29_1740, partial [Actinomycetota bacterium]|nr:hypothetical protein [Actinomycetota bacterium]